MLIYLLYIKPHYVYPTHVRKGIVNSYTFSFFWIFYLTYQKQYTILFYVINHYNLWIYTLVYFLYVSINLSKSNVWYKKSIVRYLYSFLLFIFIVYQIKSSIDKSITTHYTIKYNLLFMLHMYISFIKIIIKKFFTSFKCF